MLDRRTAVLALSALAACATPRVPDAIRAELAPTGKLRAGMNLGNALFTRREAASGRLTGVSVDLMNELAARLAVPVEFVVFATPGDVADAADKNAWDVAVLAIEPARAQRIAFSPAMTEIEATYLVRADSPLASVAQVDSPGLRIAASARAGYELYLTRTLRSATLIRTAGQDAALALLRDGGADALAALKPSLLDTIAKLPGFRVLDGKFMTVNHGLGIPRERAAAAAYVKAFVEEINASRFLVQSIQRHGVQGLSAVAP